jgi:hypothetical protein
MLCILDSSNGELHIICLFQISIFILPDEIYTFTGNTLIHSNIDQNFKNFNYDYVLCILDSSNEEFYMFYTL